MSEMKIQGNKIWDDIRKRWLVLTPEEWVRQYFIRYLTETLSVDPYRIGREVLLDGGQRADLVVYDLQGHPALVVECKAQSQPINRDVFEQVARYNIALGVVPYLAVTNGGELYCWQFDNKKGEYYSIEQLPNL